MSSKESLPCHLTEDEDYSDMTDPSDNAEFSIDEWHSVWDNPLLQQHMAPETFDWGFVYDYGYDLSGNNIGLGTLGDTLWNEHVRALEGPPVGHVGLHTGHDPDSWSGALVAFRPFNIYVDMGPIGAPQDPRESRRLTQGIATAGVGTVINVSREPAPWGDWRVGVMWADGILSSESAYDLVRLVPGEPVPEQEPGTH